MTGKNNIIYKYKFTPLTTRQMHELRVKHGEDMGDAFQLDMLLLTTNASAEQLENMPYVDFLAMLKHSYLISRMTSSEIEDAEQAEEKKTIRTGAA